MQLQSTRNLSLPQEQAWDVLNDVDVLKRCIPGCESLVREPDGALQATVVAKIGPVSAKFNGRVTFEDVVKPSGYRLVFAGQGGAAGFARGHADVHLEPLDNGTRLTYTSVANVGGKLAQIGSRLIEGAARKLSDDFFDRLEEEVRASAPAAAQPAPAVIAAASYMPHAVAQGHSLEENQDGNGAWKRWLVVAATALVLGAALVLATWL